MSPDRMEIFRPRGFFVNLLEGFVSCALLPSSPISPGPEVMAIMILSWTRFRRLFLPLLGELGCKTHEFAHHHYVTGALLLSSMRVALKMTLSHSPMLYAKRRL